MVGGTGVAKTSQTEEKKQSCSPMQINERKNPKTAITITEPHMQIQENSVVEADVKDDFGEEAVFDQDVLMSTEDIDLSNSDTTRCSKQSDKADDKYAELNCTSLTLQTSQHGKHKSLIL